MRKYLLLGVSVLLIMVLVAISLPPNQIIKQKVKSVEIGNLLHIEDLIAINDDAEADFLVEPSVPLALGDMDITFLVKQQQRETKVTFTYHVVDTTPPVIVKIEDAVLHQGAVFQALDFVKVLDNSGQDLAINLEYQHVYTNNIMNSSVELVVYDDSENKSSYTLHYQVLDIMEIAPELPGTIKQLIRSANDEIVTYNADQVNPFGLKPGDYVGEYRRKVYLDGQEVGGLVLIPKVVNMILDGLEVEKYPVPIDISEVISNQSIDLSFLKSDDEHQSYNDYKLSIDTHGNQVSISNPLIECQIKVYTPTDNDLTTSEALYKTDLPRKLIIKLGDEQQFIDDLYFKGFLPFGQRIGSTDKVIMIKFTNDQTSNSKSIDTKRLLSIGESLVFLKDIKAGTPSVIRSRGNANRAEIALTFDDGGGGMGTVLRILNQRGIKGSFFLLARELLNNPSRWQQAIKDGHLVLNHTVGHKMSLPYLSRNEMIKEIIGWEVAARKVLGNQYVAKMKRSFPYFRSPGGNSSRELQKVLGELGYSITAYWSHEDIWIMRTVNNPKKITIPEYFIKSASRGDIFLMHGGSAKWLVDIIGGVEAKGYRFKSLLEIID